MNIELSITSSYNLYPIGNHEIFGFREAQYLIELTINPLIMDINPETERDLNIFLIRTLIIRRQQEESRRRQLGLFRNVIMLNEF